MVNLKRILVTTDLSEFSLAALEYATSFGLLFSSRIYVLHVADKLPSVLAIGGLDVNEEQYRTRAREQAEESLASFVSQHFRPEARVIPVVRYGIPADEIRLFAEQERIDMIVMATHGHSGLKYILLGSVAEKVVRQSPVPVLTIKPARLQEAILDKEDIEHDLHLP